MPRIEKWTIHTYAEDMHYIKGLVYDDDKHRFEDGDYIRTSRIKSFDLENMKVQTNNTLYDLGDIDSSFKDYLDINDIKLENYTIK